nr:hypothetical protein [Tanacetum cinerariifolium]
KGVVHFRKKGKLAHRFVVPFEITERISPVAYRLRLPQELNGVHDTFHVSNLKKCLADLTLPIPLKEIQVDTKLNFVKEPVEILVREFKKLKQSRISIVKKSRMELYIENRENGRMILNSVQNGPLVWTTVVQEDGTTRTKKYEELSVAEKLQANCDLKATKIVLQGDDPIACLNKAMAFLIVVASSWFPSTNNQLRISSNLRNQATIQDDKEDRKGLLNVIIVKVKETWLDNALSLRGQGTLHGLRKRQYGQAAQTTILNIAAFQTEDLDAYDYDCADVSNAKAIQVAQKKVKKSFENADSSSRVELIASKIKYANKVVLNFRKEFSVFSSFKEKGNDRLRFEDPDHPDKVYKVVKALYGLHQAPRACMIFRYLKGKPHLGLWYPKDSPFDLCKKQTIVATSSIEAGYVAAASCCTQSWLVQKQTALGKDKSNPLMVDNLPKIVWYSTHYVSLMKSWLVQKQTNLGKEKSNPLTVDSLLKTIWSSIHHHLANEVLTIPGQTTTGKENSNPFMAGSLPKTIMTTFIHFWNTVAIKYVNDITRLQALVNRKKVVITEAAIREVLRLDDAEGGDCLSNEEIFAELAHMGYEKPSTKLTFYKAFFSSQWKFLIHTILQSLSAKRTSWNEFSSVMASAVICLSTGRKFNFSKYIFYSLVRNVDNTSKFYMYPRFIQLLIRNQIGDLSTYTTKYSSPALTQKVFANMRRVGKGFLGVETPLFEGMLVEQVVEEGGDDEEHVEVDIAAQGDDTTVQGDDAQEPSIPSPTPPTPPPQHPQDLPSTSQVQHTPPQSPQPQPQPQTQAPQQAADFPMSLLQEAIDACAALTRRVEHLELKRVGTSQRVDTSKDTVMDDTSNQWRKIDELDQDDAVALMDDNKEDKKEEEAKVVEDDQVQERQAESQAEIYKIDLDHASKVLSMQEDEPAEVQEVVDVVTTAKLITEVVTAASEIVTSASTIISAAEPQVTAATITAAPVRVVATSTRKRKGVVIRDPKEESTTSSVIPADTKSKDKGKWIMVEEPKPLKKKQQVEMDKEYARKLHAELNKDIDWDIAIDHGMSYDDINPIFEAKFNSNIKFLLKTKEQTEEEKSKALQSINETPAQKAAKRRKLNEEVEDLKRHLEIVPDEDDDVYTEATPLARKIPHKFQENTKFPLSGFGSYPRFTWVFFLATKDETPEILKNFIAGIENQMDHKVKTIRCDNKTEFKNRIMNEFCEMKGIRREFSVARTPWVLVIKPHNKTPYDLFLVRKSALSFMRPFRCPVTILNTLDHLGLKSSEDKVAGDARKKSTEVPRKENGVHDPAKEGDKNDQEKDLRNQKEALRKQFEQEYERLFGQREAANTNSTNKLNTVSSLVNVVSSSFTTVDPGRERAQRNEFKSKFGQDKDAHDNITYMMFTPISVVGSYYVNLGRLILVNAATLPNTDLSTDPLMPDLEDTADLQDTGIFSGAYDDKVEGDPFSAPQTRRMTKTSQEHDMVRIEAIRLFLAYALFMGFTMYQKDVKSAFLYGTIEEEVYVCQPAGFKAPHFHNKVYKVEKALYGLHQASRAYDIIFGSTKTSLCTEFEGLMHKKFQMSSIEELTFFLGLQVMQRDDGIFISQDKYVADILKKFDFSSVKTTSIPIKTNKALLKDEEAEDVDVHLYRSMIGSLMYLTATRPDIMFAVCAYARFQVTPKVSHLPVVKRIFRYLKGQPKLGLWYLRDSPFNLEAFLDSDYARSSLDMKSTIGGC